MTKISGLYFTEYKFSQYFENLAGMAYFELKSNFNNQKVTYLYSMFKNCSSLTNINLFNFNTQNVIYMDGMFDGSKSLTNINISNFDTQKVIYMDCMFMDCLSLTNINLSNLNTQKY